MKATNTTHTCIIEDEWFGRAERAFEIATNVYQDLHKLSARYEAEMQAKDQIIYGLQKKTSDLIEENRRLLHENNNLLKDNIKMIQGESPHYETTYSLSPGSTLAN